MGSATKVKGDENLSFAGGLRRYVLNAQKILFHKAISSFQEKFLFPQDTYKYYEEVIEIVNGFKGDYSETCDFLMGKVGFRDTIIRMGQNGSSPKYRFYLSLERINNALQWHEDCRYVELIGRSRIE